MKCKIPQINPFICHVGSDHVAGTVSNVEQSLSSLQNALYFVPGGETKAVSFGYDDCCAFQYVLEGLRGALREVVEQLADYAPKGESPTD